MKSYALIASFAAASALFLLAAGCGSGGGTTTALPIVTATPTTSPTPSPSPTPIPVDAPISSTGRYQNLVYTLSTPHSVYKAGVVAPLTLTVENTGSADVSAADAPLFIDEADYANASMTASAPFATTLRLFPVGTIFKAGETITLPQDRMLTAFYSPLTYRVFRVHIGGGSLNTSNAPAPGTALIGLTVL